MMDLSAPTGGGKTVLFELALIEMLSSNIRSSSISKCVYVAPTKASRHTKAPLKLDTNNFYIRLYAPNGLGIGALNLSLCV